jgi:hypothetical protein
MPIMIDGYLGDGYGTATPKGLAAIERLTDELHLEQTYSAKAYAAFADSDDTPKLFWLTCNGRPVPDRFSDDLSGLPPPLNRL